MEKKLKQNQRKIGAARPAAVILHEEDFTQVYAGDDKDHEESDDDDKSHKDEVRLAPFCLLSDE